MYKCKWCYQGLMSRPTSCMEHQIHIWLHAGWTDFHSQPNWLSHCSIGRVSRYPPSKTRFGPSKQENTFQCFGLDHAEHQNTFQCFGLDQSTKTRFDVLFWIKTSKRVLAPEIGQNVRTCFDTHVALICTEWSNTMYPHSSACQQSLLCLLRVGMSELICLNTWMPQGGYTLNCCVPNAPGMNLCGVYHAHAS